MHSCCYIRIAALSQSSPTSNFYKTLPTALQWDHRKGLILSEIQRSGADIVCLEEVDHYHDFLMPEMTKLGYDGLYASKPKSACLSFPGNNGPDGCALFYRKSVLTFMDKKEIRYTEGGRPSNQLALVLKLAFHERPFCVAVTHLKAKDFPTERLQQGQQLMAIVNQFAQGAPIVVCGDFNASPAEPVYQHMLSHNLASAYCIALKEEPSFTSWKFRPGKELRYTIDYIWYSRDGLALSNVLGLPSAEDIGPDALPMLQYPSDHLALCAKFSLL